MKKIIHLSLIFGIFGCSLWSETAPQLQPWVKKGCIMAPGFAGTPSGNRLSAPSVVRLKNGRLRMYFWTTGAFPGSSKVLHLIYAAEASPADPMKWTLIRNEPVLGPSSSGNINNEGPGFPYVLPRDDGPWLMYIGEWGSWAAPGELSNRTGLAISRDEGVTWEMANEELLPLGRPGKHDAGLTGSVCVLRQKPDFYQMWYTAGERYAILDWISPGFKRGIVHVGYATSKDGVKWDKYGCPLLSPRLDSVKGYEAVVSKPCVIYLNGIYHMWLSVFTMDGGYRFNYARSKDGVEWERFTDREIMPLSPGEFDSINQSYANVVEVGDELWLFYTGNGTGTTGIGLATMKKSALK